MWYFLTFVGGVIVGTIIAIIYTNIRIMNIMGGMY